LAISSAAIEGSRTAAVMARLNSGSPDACVGVKA
jgi:hypothetical protein